MALFFLFTLFLTAALTMRDLKATQPQATTQTDRWVLVTGAAKRLGRELALAFARSGWHVLCHYHRSRNEALQLQAAIEAQGQRCLLFCQDLAYPESAKTLLQQIQTQIGAAPDCIVNNASLFEADEALSASAEQLAQHFQVNTLVPLMLGNAWAQQIAHAKQAASAGTRPCLIHVLDQKTHNLNPDYFSYTVSKLALERSVALQAQALAPQIRVCGLSPGLMYLSGAQTPANFEMASRINLLQKPIDPAQVAQCAVFMAETEALNGCTVQADNGQHLVPLARDVMFAVEPGVAS